MSLMVYTLEQDRQWDNIVQSFQNYDVFYLSGYVKAFKLHGDGEPLLFYYEDGNVKGINVLMKRDISADKRFREKLQPDIFFDVTTPYSYGGWLIEGDEDSTKLFDAYEKWCKENHIISEFVRFHPVLRNHSYSKSFYNIRLLGKTVAIQLSSKDGVWENITSKNRNMIRKARKNKVQIYHGNFPEIYEKFRKIYNATMDRDNADDYYYFETKFYESIIKDLSYHSQIFYAQLDEKVIAAAIILTANGRMNYHLSGSVKKYQNLAPTNLLLYEAAMWGNANGYKTFHLGGGVGAQEDSLYQFKKSFNRGVNCQFYIGEKVYDEKLYEELGYMREDVEFNKESSFFPLYRA